MWQGDGGRGFPSYGGYSLLKMEDGLPSYGGYSLLKMEDLRIELDPNEKARGFKIPYPPCALL